MSWFTVNLPRLSISNVVNGLQVRRFDLNRVPLVCPTTESADMPVPPGLGNGNGAFVQFMIPGLEVPNSISQNAQGARASPENQAARRQGLALPPLRAFRRPGVGHFATPHHTPGLSKCEANNT